MIFQHQRRSAAALVVCLLMLSGCKDKALPNVPAEQQAIAAEITELHGNYSVEPDVGIVAIDLHACKIDDAMIGRIAAAIPDLRTLDIKITPITDASVQHLKKLKKLDFLDIGNDKTRIRVDVQEGVDGQKLETKVEVPIPLLSPAAVQSLRSELPNLVIEGVDLPDAPANANSPNQ